MISIPYISHYFRSFRDVLDMLDEYEQNNYFSIEVYHINLVAID